MKLGILPVPGGWSTISSDSKWSDLLIKWKDEKKGKFFNYLFNFVSYCKSFRIDDKVLNSSGFPRKLIEPCKSFFDRTNEPMINEDEGPNLTDFVSSLLLAAPALTLDARRDPFNSSVLVT